MASTSCKRFVGRLGVRARRRLTTAHRHAATRMAHNGRMASVSSSALRLVKSCQRPKVCGLPQRVVKPTTVRMTYHQPRHTLRRAWTLRGGAASIPTNGVRLYSTDNDASNRSGRKFMACIDGSELSTKALEAALSLHHTDRNDHVYVVCVPPLVQAPAGLGADFENALVEERDAAVNKVVADAEKLCTDKEAKFTTVIGTPSGGPREEILRIAGEFDVDFIVVGSRGMGAIQRALLGSTSSHVVHHAPCNVVVVHT